MQAPWGGAAMSVSEGWDQETTGGVRVTREEAVRRIAIANMHYLRGNICRSEWQGELRLVMQTEERLGEREAWQDPQPAL